MDFVLRAVSALSPDIILLPLDKSNNKTVSKLAFKVLEDKLENFEAVSIGCGLALDEDTNAFFIALISHLKNSQVPLVIDADGLNILSNNAELKLPQNTILTPHPLELSRILSVAVEEVIENPEFFAKKCSEKL